MAKERGRVRLTQARSGRGPGSRSRLRACGKPRLSTRRRLCSVLDGGLPGPRSKLWLFTSGCGRCHWRWRRPRRPTRYKPYMVRPANDASPPAASAGAAYSVNCLSSFRRPPGTHRADRRSAAAAAACHIFAPKSFGVAEPLLRAAESQQNGRKRQKNGGTVAETRQKMTSQKTVRILSDHRDAAHLRASDTSDMHATTGRTRSTGLSCILCYGVSARARSCACRLRVADQSLRSFSKNPRRYYCYSRPLGRCSAHACGVRSIATGRVESLGACRRSSCNTARRRGRRRVVVTVGAAGTCMHAALDRRARAPPKQAHAACMHASIHPCNSD